MIAEGAYSKVYLAFNCTSGETMAVKQVAIDHMKGSLMIKKIADALRSERQILRRLAHENIVDYLGFEENPETINMCVYPRPSILL